MCSTHISTIPSIWLVMPPSPLPSPGPLLTQLRGILSLLPAAHSEWSRVDKWKESVPCLLERWGIWWVTLVHPQHWPGSSSYKWNHNIDERGTINGMCIPCMCAVCSLLSWTEVPRGNDIPNPVPVEPHPWSWMGPHQVPRPPLSEFPETLTACSCPWQSQWYTFFVRQSPAAAGYTKRLTSPCNALNIVYFKAQSLLPKLDELKCITAAESPDVIVL